MKYKLSYAETPFEIKYWKYGCPELLKKILKNCNMTQEKKDLLLKDLCARLPYGVKCKLIYNNKAIKDEDATLFGIDKYGHFLFAEFGEDTREFVCKPYLFPLSSMTEEQKEEFDQLIEIELKAINDEINPTQATAFEVDFYNKHHLDWRDLIPMGLANDATGLNIY